MLHLKDERNLTQRNAGTEVLSIRLILLSLPFPTIGHKNVLKNIWHLQRQGFCSPQVAIIFQMMVYE